MALPAEHPDPGMDSTVELSRLRRRLRSYELRYGAMDEAAPGRLESLAQERGVQLERVRERIAELEAERHRLTMELDGYQKGIALALRARIEEIRRSHDEAWSPFPVLGFRMWGIKGGGLHGAVMPWSEPRFVARCEGRGGAIEVPHTDGRCGTPACGIYVAKSYRDLDLVSRDGDRAVGVVGLSGKVVEHEHGYRGQRAEVVAIGVFVGDRVLFADTLQRIEEVFADPRGAVRAHGQMRADAADWVRESLEGVGTAWTLRSA